MISDADREFEIAALAAAAERRNSPARLLILAAALLVISASFAGFSRSSAAGAAASVARAQADSRRVETLAEAIARLDVAAQEDWATQYEAYPLIRSTLNQLASNAGVAPAPTWGDPRNEVLQDSPLTRQVIAATLNGADLEPALNWLTAAQREIDGLEIVHLDLMPNDVGWTIRCRFGRWENRQ